MNFYEEVKLAYLEYMESRDRVRLTNRKHNPKNSEGKVHASALGYCPLLRASQRNNVPMKYEPTVAERLSSQHLMTQGTRDAEPFQEAMIWKFGKMKVVRPAKKDKANRFLGITPSVPKGAVAEYSVDSNEYRVRGRMDSLVSLDGEMHIIEIKRRDTPRSEEVPQPKLGDIFQIMTYKILTGAKHAHLLTINRYFPHLWDLKEVDGGYILVSEYGELWDSQWNSPEYLNKAAWLAEIERHWQYTFGGLTADPSPENQNDWQCGKWLGGDKPMRYKGVYQGKLHRPATFIPKCPFWCHTPKPEPVEYAETTYKSGEYVLWDPLTMPTEKVKEDEVENDIQPN